MSATPYVAVIGPSDASEPEAACAYAVGTALAARGAVVLCGGLGGAMAAAAAGARSASGLSVGLLPGTDRGGADPELTVVLPTGLGEMRGGLLVRCADAVIAVGGSWGTLAEVALAVRTGVPVVAVGGWSVADADGADMSGVRRAASAEEAVGLALEG